MDIKDAISNAAVRLKAAGIGEPTCEASSLLSFALGRDRTFLIAHPEYLLADDEAQAFENAVNRREQREPFQYITGRQEFFGLEILVDKNVLIPRPETELLVEHALWFLKDSETKRFCEIGVGSGCISMAVLVNEKASDALAIDLSADAISVARSNAERQGVLSRIRFLLSDVFSEAGPERFDLIVSNPPYISEADITTLQPEVKDHEPHLALSDKADGLSIIRKIVKDSPGFLRQGGALMMEIGIGQSTDVASMFNSDLWQDVKFFEDLAGIPRVVVAKLRQ